MGSQLPQRCATYLLVNEYNAVSYKVSAQHNISGAF